MSSTSEKTASSGSETKNGFQIPKWLVAYFYSRRNQFKMGLVFRDHHLKNSIIFVEMSVWHQNRGEKHPKRPIFGYLGVFTKEFGAS